MYSLQTKTKSAAHPSRAGGAQN